MAKDLSKIETVIFDMDGVITSEKYYWISSALTVMEIFYGKDYLGVKADYPFENDIDKIIEDSRIFVDERFISNIKNRSINTNWDLAFFSISLFLIEILKTVKNQKLIELINREGITREILMLIGENMEGFPQNLNISYLQRGFFSKYPDMKGFEYIDLLNYELERRTPIKKRVFTRDNRFWTLTYELFQEWFLGSKLFEKNYGKKLSRFHKRGMLYIEKPIVALDKIDSMLKKLYGKYKLGIATGRPYDEIIVPLKRWGLLKYFETKMIATHREVSVAQKKLKLSSLSKPHPFTFLKSILFDKTDRQIIDTRLPLTDGEKYLIVTDSVSDIKIAKKLRCPSLVVLTGTIDEKQKEGLLAHNPDFVIDDVSMLSGLLLLR